jgi:hypothetical protein
MPKKKPAKRLPKWFRPADGAASELIPELAAQKLFYQIAKVVGVEGASAIFKDIVRLAKEAAQSVKPRGRPKGSRNDITESVRVLTAWQLLKKAKPKLTRERFAEWYEGQCWNDEPGPTADTVLRQLSRLLKSDN